MILTMRRPLVLLGMAFVIGGCGGGHHQAPQQPAPVTEQLRASLQSALHQPASLASFPRRAAEGPDVRSCGGPKAGGAGEYHCGVGSISVAVRVSADGSWIAQIPRDPRDRHVAAMAAWGFGLRLP
jgi:hypothetical protein